MLYIYYFIISVGLYYVKSLVGLTFVAFRESSILSFLSFNSTTVCAPTCRNIVQPSILKLQIYRQTALVAEASKNRSFRAYIPE